MNPFQVILHAMLPPSLVMLSQLSHNYEVAQQVPQILQQYITNPIEQRVDPALPNDPGFQAARPNPLQAGPSLVAKKKTAFGLVNEGTGDQLMDLIPGVHNHPVYMGGTDQDPRTQVVNHRTFDMGPFSKDLGTKTSYLPPSNIPNPFHYSNDPSELETGLAEPYEEAPRMKEGIFEKSLRQIPDQIKGVNLDQ